MEDYFKISELSTENQSTLEKILTEISKNNNVVLPRYYFRDELTRLMPKSERLQHTRDILISSILDDDGEAIDPEIKETIEEHLSLLMDDALERNLEEWI